MKCNKKKKHTTFSLFGVQAPRKIRHGVAKLVDGDATQKSFTIDNLLSFHPSNHSRCCEFEFPRRADTSTSISNYYSICIDILLEVEPVI